MIFFSINFSSVRGCLSYEKLVSKINLMEMSTVKASLVLYTDGLHVKSALENIPNVDVKL